MAVYGVDCCPFLGLQEDSASFLLYPSTGASCLVNGKSAGVVAARQEQYCLTRNYARCPRLLRAARQTNNRPDRLYLPLWAMVGVIFLTVGAAWGIIGLIDRVQRDVPSGPALVSTGSQKGLSGNEQSVAATSPIDQTPQASVGASSASSPLVVATPTATRTVLRTATATARPPSTPTAVPVRATAVASTSGSPQSYVVQSGDTLSGIARSFGVGIDALAQANGMQQSDVLPAGTRLAIPVSGTRHVVQAGDTLSTLAQRYGVSSDEIATVNRLTNNDVLTVGQQLVIPTR